MIDGRDNGIGKKEHVMQKEKQKERKVKFRKKRRKGKRKTAEEINNDENTFSLHSTPFLICLSLITLYQKGVRHVPHADPVISLALINTIIRLVERFKVQERTIHLCQRGELPVFSPPHKRSWSERERGREITLQNGPHIHRFEISHQKQSRKSRLIEQIEGFCNLAHYQKS